LYFLFIVVDLCPNPRNRFYKHGANVIKKPENCSSGFLG